MNAPIRAIAKSRSASDASDAVVVSFASKWNAQIGGDKFSVVLRKRVPVTIRPKWLYFHVNAPIGAIRARAHVEGVERIGLVRAIALSSQTALDEHAIRNYLVGTETVGAYFISKIEIAAHVARTKEINTVMVYYPPQSFFVLSVEGKKLLNKMCGFAQTDSENVGD